MNIIITCIKNSRFTIFFTVLLALFGLYCYIILPKQESPEVAAPLAVITTVYPGASPEDVERLVTRPIEEDLPQVSGYDYCESFSQNSVSSVILYLENNADVEKAWADLSRRMNDVQRLLPDEARPIEINTNLAETAGIIISLSNDSLPQEELSSLAQKYKNKLLQVDGIARFDIQGEKQDILLIKVDKTKITNSGLSWEQLFNILKAQNIQIPPGSVKQQDFIFNVRIPGAFQSISAVENTLLGVSPVTGIPLRLKDIAAVGLSPDENAPRIRNQGHSAVLLTGYFQPDRNVLEVGNNLRKELDKLKKKAPAGLQIKEILYQPKDVSRSISTFIQDLLIGLILVITVVLLGMGFRNALIASTAIPLSILITFIAMVPLGIKVHEISIAALIMVLGILVDDAIVMTDAIQVQLDQGLEKMAACAAGLKNAAVPILTSTLTTMAAFAPLLFVPGPAGEFLRSIPQVIMTALLASFIIAMLLTPTLAYLFFKKAPSHNHRSRIRNFFTKFLDLSMRRKRGSLLATLLVFLLALYGITFLDLQFFPKANKNILYVDITAPPSSSLEKTAQLTGQVETWLKKQPEIVGVTSSIGSGLPKFYITLPALPKSPQIAQIMLQVDPRKNNRFDSNEELADYLQQQINQQLLAGRIRVNMLAKAYPGQPLQIRVRSKNAARLAETSAKVKKTLSDIKGSLNVAYDLDEPVNEFQVKISIDQAAALGISNYDVQRQINIALSGAQVSVLRSLKQDYKIILRSNIASLKDLKILPIKSPVTNQTLQLQQIADITQVKAIPTIRKYNGIRTITVSGDVKAGYNAVSIENKFREKVASLDLAGVELIYEGERTRIIDNFGNLGRSAIFAIFIIYLILMLQFKSFGQPFIIFITIPLALIGSIAGLLIFRQPMSFTALLGMISLIGLVVRNAILLIEYINSARSDGMKVEEACKYAVELRLRPILLTAITAIMGLLDLALSRNPLFVPMAIALMSGLFVATVLTMVIVPVIYSLIVREA
ncbi:Acriflavin resistance protein [Syntrophomonas zehnderi OL-4]|uniref:Acriflavin resistance protein n=1 Tax=Syntrophomonas zehnderi OL-4 TaxID=690567 RepID=A0A0E4GAQ7_9FIRM|nr:efflux RND transporter permease subunit [Syntrophomonas zehnderi]CFX40716.1 Acriflavin resistance protein [Syntrophomonas zehnderi OL-4]